MLKQHTVFPCSYITHWELFKITDVLMVYGLFSAKYYFWFPQVKMWQTFNLKNIFSKLKMKENDIGIGIGLFISLNCDILKIHNWCFSHHSHYEPHIYHPITSASDHSSTLTLSVCMFVACSMFVPYVVRQSRQLSLLANLEQQKCRDFRVGGLTCVHDWTR